METTNGENIKETLENKENKCTKSFRDEKSLRIIALIILIIGVIATIIMAFTIVVVSTQQAYYDANGNLIDSATYTERVFNPSGLAVTLGTLFLSFVICIFLRVISNISISLKEIKEKNK